MQYTHYVVYPIDNTRQGWRKIHSSIATRIGGSVKALSAPGPIWRCVWCDPFVRRPLVSFSFCAINHLEAAGALHVSSRFGGRFFICRCEGCFQAVQHSLTALAAASGTEWCDDLDLRQPPRGCSRAEGQNVRKGLCKMLWLQEVVRVLWVRVGLRVRGKRYISITCAALLLLANVTFLVGPLFMLYI